MFCSWQGEVELGGIEGVAATRSGFMQGSEVVEVEFDTSRISYARLLRHARTLRCADRAFPLSPDQRQTAERILGSGRVGSLDRFRPDGSIKYYLSQTPFRFVPMTAYQQVLVNRLIYQGGDPGDVLSPRQRLMSRAIHTRPDVPRQNRVATDRFTADWAEVWEQIGGS